MKKTPLCLQHWFCLAFGVMSGTLALVSGTLAVSAQMRGDYWTFVPNALMFILNSAVVLAEGYFIDWINRRSA